MGSFPQTPTSVEEGGVAVPSCISCPGYRRKPRGMEVFFYYSFGQTRRAWQGQALGSPGKLSSPHPTPPPGGATRQRERNASQRGKWTPSGSVPGWSNKQSYCTNIQSGLDNTACLPGPRMVRAGPGSAASRREGQATARAVARAGPGIVAAEGRQPRAGSEFVGGVGEGRVILCPARTGSRGGVVRGCSGTRRELSQSR